MIPDIGPAWIDVERDPVGSLRRMDEFDRICVDPLKETPPRPSEAPAWCAWTPEADKVIRANNVKARD